MILFYVDEAGNPYPHCEPLFDGQTPLFCLSAIAIRAERWREIDRALLGLKRALYAVELGQFAARYPDKRPEHFEVKGSYLCKPSNARLYRNRVFALKVLEALADHDAKLFAAVWRKDPANPTPPASIYNHSLQVLTERFHHHCSALGETGLIIVDSRTKTLDFSVASGHLGFLFGHQVGRTYTTVVESPLFAESELSAGVQYADIVGACIYGNFYQRRCSNVGGYFEGASALTMERHSRLAAGVACVHVPARNYTHCGRYWTPIEQLQFRRTDVPAPGPGTVVAGYYGFRELGATNG